MFEHFDEISASSDSLSVFTQWLETADQVWVKSRVTDARVQVADAATIAALYERRSDFVRLTERLDPRGAFRNAWLEARVLGTG